MNNKPFSILTLVLIVLLFLNVSTGVIVNNVEAVPPPNRLKINVSPSEGGTVTRDPTGFWHMITQSWIYGNGTVVTLTANPNSGYVFDDWGGHASGTNTVTTVTVDSFIEVDANFRTAVVYRLMLSYSPFGAGTVTRNPPGTWNSLLGSWEYDEGTEVTLTANTNPGYEFFTWGMDASGTNPVTTVTMDSNKHVQASWQEETEEYTLTTLVYPSGSGIITLNPSGDVYNEDTPVTATAVASSGYEFVSWGGHASGTNPVTSVIMDSDKSITANFEPVSADMYTLTTSVSPSGSGIITLNPSGDVYNEDTPVTATAIPNSGYEFDRWGGHASGTNPVTSVIMDSDKGITANFIEEEIPSMGNILYVGGSGPNNYSKIQDAIDDAESGGIVYVYEGTYYENLYFPWGVVLYLCGSDADEVIIDGGNNGPVLEIDYGDTSSSYIEWPTETKYTLLIDGITFTHGSGLKSDFPGMYDMFDNKYIGGAIVISGTAAKISNCTFRDNIADYGGGIFNCGTSIGNWRGVTVENCKFYNNKARKDGGCIYSNDDSEMIIANCIFQQKSTSLGCDGNGAGVYLTGQEILYNCIFYGLSAGSYGGGIYYNHRVNPNDRALILNSIFWYNVPDDIAYNYHSERPLVSNCVIQGGEYDFDMSYLFGLMIIEDPKFVDPNNGDFHIESNSPCIDQGLKTGYWDECHCYRWWTGQDFEGDDRIVDGDLDGASAPDIGPDEFSWKIEDFNLNPIMWGEIEEDSEKYMLDIFIIPSEGGYISRIPNGYEYESGMLVNITAIEFYGYEFDHWSGDVSGTDLNIKIKMDSNKEIIANFSATNGIDNNQTKNISENLSVIIITPSIDADVSGVFKIVGTAENADGTIQSVQIKIDNGDWNNADGTTSWTFDWNTTSLSDGSHIINVRCYDGSSYSEVETVIVNVDNGKSITIPKDFTPGFELILVVSALAFILYYKRKKQL
ncbi:hypothetical protein MBGDC06_00021 [Thermoplasmatales archaeon SCGC AB-539-C06]|nr:hypothetical protein MBGDC06_00021 [Thermoplasmatales archaeon SCGC AB-539-C06]